MASVAAGRHLVRQPRDVRAETGLAGLRNDYAPCAVVPGLRGRNRRASTSRPNCGDPARQLRAHSYRKYFERLQPQLTAEPYGQITGNPGRAHSNRPNPEGHEDSKEKTRMRRGRYIMGPIAQTRATSSFFTPARRRSNGCSFAAQCATTGATQVQTDDHPQ